MNRDFSSRLYPQSSLDRSDCSKDPIISSIDGRRFFDMSKERFEGIK